MELWLCQGDGEFHKAGLRVQGLRVGGLGGPNVDRAMLYFFNEQRPVMMESPVSYSLPF